MHPLNRTFGEPEFESPTDEMEANMYEQWESDEYGAFEAETPFSEEEEMELAAQLLEVSSDQELDQFLGKLIGGGMRALGRFARSGVGRHLGGMLKGVAKKALPVVGGALGSFIPIPGVGTALGSALGSAAANLFEMELEGLSPEEQEFEVARRIVRLGGAAAAQAANMPPNLAPAAAAQQALAAAARIHAPGLLRPQGADPVHAPTPGGRGRSGRWIRRGNRIVLMGV